MALPLRSKRSLVAVLTVVAVAACGDDSGVGGTSEEQTSTGATAGTTVGGTSTDPSATGVQSGSQTGGSSTTVAADGTAGTTTTAGTTGMSSGTTGVGPSTTSGMPGTSSGGFATTTGSSSGTTGGGPACGNGGIDPGEQCDGADLQGFDCASLGLGVGILACDPVTCTFDVTGCMAVAACGNGVVDPGEQCDGADLQGFDCGSLGFTGGILACDPITCTFDTSMCTNIGGTTG